MSDIFISYSRIDRVRVKIMAEAFERQGWSVWWDPEIQPGDIWDEVIEEALDTAKCVVVVWSKNSVKSRWVRVEANSAADRENLIPVKIDDVNPPLRFRMIQIARLVDWDGISCHREFEKVLESVSALAGSPVKSRQSKTRPEREHIAELPSRPRRKTKQVFRSEPTTLSLDDVISMLKKKNLFNSTVNKDCKEFANDFNIKEYNGDKVVIDFTSELMWQQSGSTNYMKYEKTKQWLEELNRKGFAGFNDWRLPTLEEGMSLMEPEKKNDDLYIDPVFDKKQRWIFTCDKVQGGSLTWGVHFSLGLCDSTDAFPVSSWVRAVRSGQAS